MALRQKHAQTERRKCTDDQEAERTSRTQKMEMRQRPDEQERGRKKEDKMESTLMDRMGPNPPKCEQRKKRRRK